MSVQPARRVSASTGSGEPLALARRDRAARAHAWVIALFRLGRVGALARRRRELRQDVGRLGRLLDAAERPADMTAALQSLLAEPASG